MANLTETARWEGGIYQLETSDPVMGGADGIDNLQAKQLANRTLWLKQEVEKRAPLASPALTGAPTAPTPAQTVNNTQIATTAYVRTAIATLVGSAPAALDTLAEIATALGADGNLKATLLAAIGEKATQADFVTLKNLLIGIPMPYPLAAVPSGCLAFNGQAFNKATYPILAQKYPSGVLPDLRGEFLRGWDNGRGVDSGRGLLSMQSQLVGKHEHRLEPFYSVISNPVNNRSGKLFEYAVGTGTGIVHVDSRFKGEIYDNFTSIGIPLSWGAGGSMYTDKMIKMSGEYAETRPRNIAFQYICLAA